MDLFDAWWMGSRASKGDVRDAKVAARNARRRARNSRIRLKRRVEQLEERQAYFALVMASILEALDEDGVITRERLRALMERVDLRDGTADGRFDPEAARERGEDERGLSDASSAKKHRPVSEDAPATSRSRARRRSRRRRS